ncbi:MAG: DUF3224 domain-containing protein [Microthrixaceae bacterium]
MKRLLMVPLVMCALMLGVTTAAAGPPEEASGDWTYVPDLAGLTFRTAGNTTFVEGTEVSTFNGTFEGTSDDEFVVVCHQKGLESYMNFVKITIEFTGEVEGRAGELTMKATGKQDSTTCDPSGAIWSGKWVILGGTDELADLHGNGTWSGPSFDLDYTGKIHFN